MTEPSWYVSVLSWNDRSATVACLESLRQVREPAIGVVCVDQGSTDGSADAIREQHPEVELIENDRNLGFSGGHNVAIRRALERGAEWVVLLNNDAEIAPDCIAAFDAAAREEPSAGILAGKLYLADRRDHIWFAGQRFLPWLGYSGRARGQGRRDRPRYRRRLRTDRAVGALMGISRRTIEEVGMLDEDLFFYVEDVDLSLRARAAGFEVILVPEARAWHEGSASTGGAASTHNLYFGTRNTVVVCERHRPLPVPLSWLRRGVILATFAAHALGRPNRSAALSAVLEGYRDARAGRLGPRRERPA
ncbi:MAG: glycosyltransferase family 2 protein [Solirubrobacterales bacterium]